MPNWTTNHLYVRATAGAVARLAEAITPDTCYLDFGVYVPVPPELLALSSPVDVVRKPKRADLAPSQPTGCRTVISRAEAKQLVQAYGTYDRVAWTVEHWGTKWMGGEVELLHRGERTLVLRFQTPWCEPTGFFQALAADEGVQVVEWVAVHEGGAEGRSISPAGLDYFDLRVDDEAGQDGGAPIPDEVRWRADTARGD